MNAKFGSESRADRAIEAWLDLGPTTLSDRVVDRARAEILRTPRRSPGWPVLKLRATWRPALATRLGVAAAVIALIGLGLRLASTPSVGTPSSPSASPTASAASRTPRIVPTSFVLTGSMAIGRIGHTATLLEDGRVLIAGGSTNLGDSVTDPTTGPGTIVATAELYDPATGTFTPTGSMTTARAHHTATLLADGRVLITGGGNSGNYGGGFALASAELYDPETGTFSSTSSMGAKRLGSGAIGLADNRVLIVGGDAANAGSAELYDPATGRFGPISTRLAPLENGSGFLLRDGRVLLIGSRPAADGAAFEIYDPRNGSFGQAVSLAFGLHTATELKDGRILFLEGEPLTGLALTSSILHAEIYDPGTGEIAETTTPVTDFEPYTATLLQDARVLLVGFTGRADETLPPYGMVWDPAGHSFTELSPPSLSRRGHTATLLSDGRVLLAGGAGNFGRMPAYSTAELFQ